MEKEIKIKIVDIWSTVYTTCLKGHLKQVGNINGSDIYKTKFTIDGTQQITIVNGREITSPTFVCDAPFTIKFGGVVYKIEAGTRKILDIRLQEGNNDFIISGHGNLEIRFRRGML